MGHGVPEKPSLDGLEDKWARAWEEQGTYRFDRTKPRSAVFSIDTPPPTVSGSLHIGHVFSFTHTDIVARYRRMRGAEVFYPMGFDDNGLATERRVQNYFGVRCDPNLLDEDRGAGLASPGPRPARPSEPLAPDPRDRTGGGTPVAVSRRRFIELCQRLTTEDERAFEELWRALGLSVDWSLTYTTIGERARRASQRGFLRLLARGEAYRAEAPTLWDVDFATPVAQAELVEREIPGAYHRLRFHLADGGAVEVDTTRPELLPACVALVAHPDDPRYRRLFGASVTTPLFSVRVPVLPHALADPEKGTGVAMVCTFGDLTDVTWWRELGLPTRPIVGRDGRLVPVRFGSPGFESEAPRLAQEAYDRLAGLPVEEARREVIAALAAAGELVGEPRPIVHPVKFYENGERPLEIVTSRQWFVRVLGLREALLARGRELSWHPPFMRARYEAWVEGLSGDWNVSRQRYFGVPFPVWYPVGEDGSVDHDHPIVPSEDRLPVDPSVDVPDGYRADQRGRPGGFVGDPDVMDTWATSSLTPQIAGGWEDDPDLFTRVFPMDLRPQGHDIIRTWLFYTVVRSHLEHGSLPWRHAAISGFILDPDRKKMSKSKGNVLTPLPLIRELGADAVRYWAASGRLGVDTAFDEGQLRIGRRLAIKLLNASRFVLSLARAGEVRAGGRGPASVARPARVELLALDAAMLARLASVVREATQALEDYEHTRALERIETFFWGFCDDYLELVKERAYGGEAIASEATASARAALQLALDTVVRLFAPFLPFVTEEVWSWWKDGSVHRAPWPSVEELAVGEGTSGDGDLVLSVASAVLGQVRRAKSEAKRSMRAPVARVAVGAPPAELGALRLAEADLKAAGCIEALVWSAAETLSVAVELAS